MPNHIRQQIQPLKKLSIALKNCLKWKTIDLHHDFFDVSVSKDLEFYKNSPNVTARGFAKHHKRLKANSNDQKTVFTILSYYLPPRFAIQFWGFTRPNSPGWLPSPPPRSVCFRFLGFTRPEPPGWLPSQPPALSGHSVFGILSAPNSPVFCLPNHSPYLCFSFIMGIIQISNSPAWLPS